MRARKERTEHEHFRHEQMLEIEAFRQMRVIKLYAIGLQGQRLGSGTDSYALFLSQPTGM